MIFLQGRVVPGVRHFTKRITRSAEVFKKATGERLYPGTLNIRVETPIPINKHFSIRGVDICEPEQDLWFEICRVNDYWAYRIRPHNIKNGSGGHGDNILEVACKVDIPDVCEGSSVTISLFRDDISG